MLQICFTLISTPMAAGKEIAVSQDVRWQPVVKVSFQPCGRSLYCSLALGRAQRANSHPHSPLSLYFLNFHVSIMRVRLPPLAVWGRFACLISIWGYTQRCSGLTPSSSGVGSGSLLSSGLNPEPSNTPSGLLSRCFLIGP